MRPPVLPCKVTRSAHPAFRPAPAHVLEADTPEHVAAVPLVVLTSQGDVDYGDGVEHVDTVNGLREGHKSCSTSSTPLAESVA